MKNYAIILTLAAAAAHANESPWVVVTSNATTSYAIKRGSCTASTLDSGARSLVCIERVTTSGISSFHYIGISRDECASGVGTLVTMDMRGKLLESDQVVADGGTNASNEWDAMCLVSKGIDTKST